MAETANSHDEDCGYPDTIRDGLHPYQYYCLAKMYASRYKLKQAKICVEKLRACQPRKEAEALATVLEDTTLPKYPVPDEAASRLQEATRDKYFLDYKICRELTEQYPSFEWPYFVLSRDSIDFDEASLKMRRDLMEKVLKINPHNVRAYVVLSDVAKRQGRTEEAYSYLKKAETFYPDIVMDKEYFVPPTKEEVEKQKKEHAANIERVKKLTAEAEKNPSARSIDRRYYFLDKSGQIAVRCGPNVWPLDHCSCGCLVVKAEATNDCTPADIQVWNREGDLVFSFDSGDAQLASEGLLAVRKKWDASHRCAWGFVDTKGKESFRGNFWYLKSFSEGIASVQPDRGTIEGVIPWGFVSRSGKMTIEPIYTDVFSFSEGLAAVALNGKIGYIDKAGHFVIPPQFDLARPFSEGIANVVVFDHKKRIWDDRYIDRDGKLLFKNEYTIPGSKSLYEYAGTWTHLNAHKQRYSHFMPSNEFETDSDFRDGVVLCWKDDKYGFRDKSGK
ncbi:MAG: WG repeat-containing protein, partial [Cyanobacteria bacterium HKST-UBA02]|nr:WG repeat-containing protein [Cyanobacteria bacterium HKST-UBA02]